MQSFVFVDSEDGFAIADEDWYACDARFVAPKSSFEIKLFGVELPNIGCELDLSMFVRHGRCGIAVGTVVGGRGIA